MTHQQRFMGLWEMLKLLDSEVVFSTLSHCSNMQKKIEHARQLLSETEDDGPICFDLAEMQGLLQASSNIKGTATQLSFPGVAKSCSNLAEHIVLLEKSHGAMDSNYLYTLEKYLEAMITSFVNAMSESQVFVMTGSAAAYLNPTSPVFGQRVDDAFPKAIYDIAEAGKCRAFSRWTASVMHLMRVLEAGLIALAEQYQVVHDGSWNTTLNNIEVALRTIRKKDAGATEAQWAAEAGTHLRFIKNAFRNHVMHPLENYDEERAIAVFDNTKSFMQHLADRVKPNA